MRSWTLTTLGALALALALAGCFSGSFASGRPCQLDADCGPELRCEDGYCGGALPSASTGFTASDSVSSGAAATTIEPTTGATSSTTSATSSATGTSEPAPLCDKIDLLVVLDNSNSMDQWDGRLLELVGNFKSYAGALFEEVGSYHFAVIGTSEAEDSAKPGCQRHGALRVDHGMGLLCESYEDRPYMTERDTFDVLNIGCFTSVPEGDDDEQPMRTLLEAASRELNSAGGCNEGFLRDDALLVVLLIADEDDDHGDEQGHDGSPGDPQFWYEKLLYHKRGNAESIVIGALLGEDPLRSTCPWMLPEDKNEATDFNTLSIGAEEGVRIRSFLDKLPVGHAYVSSICADSYVDFFQQFFEEIVRDACEDFDPLATDPLVHDPTEGD